MVSPLIQSQPPENQEHREVLQFLQFCRPGPRVFGRWWAQNSASGGLRTGSTARPSRWMAAKALATGGNFYELRNWSDADWIAARDAIKAQNERTGPRGDEVVVPAEAETHTPPPSLVGKVADAFHKRKGRWLWSLLSQGRHFLSCHSIKKHGSRHGFEVFESHAQGPCHHSDSVAPRSVQRVCISMRISN